MKRAYRRNEFWTSVELRTLLAALVGWIGKDAHHRFSVSMDEYRSARGALVRLRMRCRRYGVYPMKLVLEAIRFGHGDMMVVCSSRYYAPSLAVGAGRRGVGIHWVLDLFPAFWVTAESVKAGSFVERELWRCIAPKYRLVPRVSPQEISRYMEFGLIGLSILLDTPNKRITYPTKLFEYMAFGMPIIATNVGYQSEIVRESGAGILVPPDNPTALADAIAALWNDVEERRKLGLAGRAAFLASYCWESEGERLLGLYKRIVNRRSVE